MLRLEILEEDMADDSNSNLGWFLAGLGLGAVIGILYAPKSGRETREAIVAGALEGRDYLGARAVEGREYVTARAAEGREYVTAKVGDAREAATAWADKPRDSIKQQRDSVAAAIDAGKSAYRETAEKKS